METPNMVPQLFVAWKREYGDSVGGGGGGGGGGHSNNLHSNNDDAEMLSAWVHICRVKMKSRIKMMSTYLWG